VVATSAILLAPVASIAVKAALTLGISDRSFAAKVTAWSAALVVASGVGFLLVL
jgi:uncharacterized membrane protein (DUF4010 family)